MGSKTVFKLSSPTPSRVETVVDSVETVVDSEGVDATVTRDRNSLERTRYLEGTQPVRHRGFLENLFPYRVLTSLKCRCFRTKVGLTR